jgi:hypothetical protein
MGYMRVPTDLIYGAEFRQLASISGGQLEEAKSAVLVLRLFSELAGYARSTNRPGWIDESGLRRVGDAWKDLAEEPCPFIRRADGGGYYCEIFRKENGHLAGNYVDGSKLGGRRSGLIRGEANRQREAEQQALTLSERVFKGFEGNPLNQREKEGALILIRRLDSILGLAGRPNDGVTEEIMTRAGTVVRGYEPNVIAQICDWILRHREDPDIPKDTVAALANFDRFARQLPG